MIMVYMGGHISGAHYNPAVSLAAVMRGALPSAQYLTYVVSQIVGALVAAVVVHVITGRTFAPVPGAGVSMAGALLVDVREPEERDQTGIIAGSLGSPRGMLEFWIDPQSPYAKPIFQEDKKFIFHCAGGLRSALAAKTAQDMGLKPVAHMGGGFAAWRDAGGPIEKWEPKKK